MRVITHIGAYYKTSLHLENVLDFLIFNTKYPKSWFYIFDSIIRRFKKELPNNTDSSHLSNFEEPIFKAYSMIKLTSMKNF